MRSRIYSRSVLKKNMETLVLMVVFVISMVISAGMISISKNSGLILIDKRETFGEILSVYTVKAYGKGGSIKDFLRIRFFSEKGVVITFNDSIAVETFDKLRVGQSIKVFYSARYPQIATVSNPLLTFLGGIGGLILDSILIFVTTRIWIKRIWKKR